MRGHKDKKERDQKFRLLFENNPQPMWVYDRETLEFLEVNQATVRHYGYTRDEFAGMRASDIHPPEEAERFLAAVRNHVPDQGPSLWKHRIKSGRLIDVEVAMHPISYASRSAMLAVLMDVTQRRLLEDQLRQAQKMEAVGMLAGGIAHDFNNLLTIITGYSQLLLGTMTQQDPNRSSVEQIMKAGERAAALTRQLLAFSRRQVLQPKVLDLNQVVAGLGTMLRRLIGEDVDLRLEMGPDLGRVSADPGQMEQVVMNLALNARDAMPRGGTLTIETANLILDEHYTETHVSVKPGRYVMLAVSDTGTGMDPETRSRLFEPFFTTKGQGRGTGLGLSTVFGIIKQSGGNVEVYTEPGRGTSFKVYLPRVDQAAPVEREALQAKPAKGSETILIVEDDEMVRKLVRETLEREGYRLFEAVDAMDATRICRTYPDPIHLMITDVVMPKLSGRELADRVAPMRPEMKVLYMSGYTDNAVLNNGVLDQHMAFLQKPFTPQALARKVREVLENNGKETTRRAGG